MKGKRLATIVAAAVLAASGALAFAWPRNETLALTGIVTTDGVVVSPQVGGRISKLLVREGDEVAAGQVLAVIEPVELEADRAYYTHETEGLVAQVEQNAAALRYEERETATQVTAAIANLSSAEAQLAEAHASLEDARLTAQRSDALLRDGAASEQDHDRARTALATAQARCTSFERQVEARRAALAQAHASAEQIAQRRSALHASQAQHEAAQAQQAKAEARLGYAEVRAPSAGVVNVRAALPGEVVSAGQPILTLLDPDGLWVRADVEETYIDRIRLGDRFDVRLPSGAMRQGVVVFRGVDAGFATQRDVSRTKRDIRTFEIRLRVPNQDRALAVGMTGTVLLPAGRGST